MAHDNREALEFLRQAPARQAAAGISEAVADEIRGVYLQANHLVTGKDHLVPAAKQFLAKQFFEQALQRFQWHPFHSLVAWDAPVDELVSAGRHARAAHRP